MSPDDVIALVKDSGLRGRGGAGFPTGTEMVVHPARRHDGAGAKPHYLVINADESEPGTCKDIPLMMATPHVLVEGAIIAAYAIRARHAFIYVRGEVVPVLRRLQAAVAEAYEAGLPRHRHPRVGLRPRPGRARRRGRLHLRRGDRAAGLAGGPARPAPAAAAVPRRRRTVRVPDGGQQRRVHRQRARRRARRRRLVQVDGHRRSRRASRCTRCPGHVTRPGQYEAPLGITLRELLEYAGGVRAGHELKFWTPGGSSTPLLTAEHLDVPLDYEDMAAAGSMLGTKALQIFDETTCVVRAVRRWTQFYAHESCGKCTPCREGTYWLAQIYERLETGPGTRGGRRQAARHLRRDLREVVLRARRRRGQPDHVVHQVLPRRVRGPPRRRVPVRSRTPRCSPRPEGVGV